MNGVWQTMLETVREEFLDLAGAAEWTRTLLRLLVALVLGGLLGFEREVERKPAGLRTHMLVAMGAALIMIASRRAGMSDSDLSRVAQGLVTGIGFIGGGAILKLSSERKVTGLTTAAGLWLTAAVGMTAGLGRLSLAAVSALLALLVLSAIGWIEARVERKKAPSQSASQSGS